MSFRRREFVGALSLGTLVMNSLVLSQSVVASEEIVDSSEKRDLQPALPEEGLISYVLRVSSGWDPNLYRRLLGAANEFKEGDAIVGVAAQSNQERELARYLLSHTRLAEIDQHPLLEDDLHAAISANLNNQASQVTASWTLGQLKNFLVNQQEETIQAICPGLSSDVIGCVVKLMTNTELAAVGAKIFNPLPGSNIGAKGYLGARIQPNSPTDHPQDIRWQVLCGWSYAVGDVLLGTNPVSSEVESVAAVQQVLKELLDTFGIADRLPHCVLSHIDVQAEVERREPGSTALWFQSIAGSDTANATFDVKLDRMEHYARIKAAPFGLYFETGQGADFTNGHSHGFDMVLHESRKYGLARHLSKIYAQATKDRHSSPDDRAVGIEQGEDSPGRPWVHVNDVAGFIGPEVFRTREQLVRCCLEDIVMGKLHGLCIGLDVCSTLHMDISLDDLDWCLDQLAPAGPAYLMALPTKIDPMLGYLTTGFQDHVRLRERYGLKVNDRMWEFFKQLQIIDQSGAPTEHFGDPLWVYLQYRRRQGDDRLEELVRAEGQAEMQSVRQRGVFLAEGFGSNRGELQPHLDQEIRRIYSDAKQSIWAEFDDAFRRRQQNSLQLFTQSTCREEYILHPTSGEILCENSLRDLQNFRDYQAGNFNIQIVVSDGLNALSIMDDRQLEPFLEHLSSLLAQPPFRSSPKRILVHSARVRAGYQIGEVLFGGLPGLRGLLHVIGERPGSGHRTFSVYFTSVDGSTWAVPGKVDHDQTKVVAGIANTALNPRQAAEDVARILLSGWVY